MKKLIAEIEAYCKAHDHLDACNCRVVYTIGLLNIISRAKTQIQELAPESEVKETCKNCRYSALSPTSEPCDSCGPDSSHWDTLLKRPPVSPDEFQECPNCAYEHLPNDKEPCRSCTCTYSNWRPFFETAPSAIPAPVPERDPNRSCSDCINGDKLMQGHCSLPRHENFVRRPSSPAPSAAPEAAASTGIRRYMSVDCGVKQCYFYKKQNLSVCKTCGVSHSLILRDKPMPDFLKSHLMVCDNCLIKELDPYEWRCGGCKKFQKAIPAEPEGAWEPVSCEGCKWRGDGVNACQDCRLFSKYIKAE